ncbi:MAG TPA: BON domain-containing protein [Steroidobacteraceae bacterium]|jgi:osmotically-inducible protein OsmY
MKRRARSPAPKRTAATRGASSTGATRSPSTRSPARASATASNGTDERITRAICQRLSRPVEDAELTDLANERLDVTDVRVSVAGGKVTLEGTVPERRMKPYVEALVDCCPGVQDIDNRLRVRR